MSRFVKSDDEEAIGHRHVRWILRGTAVATLATAVAVTLVVLALDLPLIVAVPVIGLAVLSAMILTPVVLARLAAGFFISKLVNARLELRPSTSSDRVEALMPWFAAKGFEHHGSWMLVDAEGGTIFGGIGSGVFHNDEHVTLALVDDVQINLASDLSNGRTLVTSSLGVVPHSALTVQGVTGGELPELFDMHMEALGRLAATGVGAVPLDGGPVQTRLRFELLDQAYFRSIPLSEARSLMFSVADEQLAPLTI